MSIEQKIAELLAESQATTVAEELDLNEGSMDKMSLAQLHAKHAKHFDNENNLPKDGGDGSEYDAEEDPNRLAKRDRAASAIEKHVQKKYGSGELRKMVRHSKDKIVKRVTKLDGGRSQDESFDMEGFLDDYLDLNEHQQSAGYAGIQEDVAALINGEDLTEEFKQKAATIFEAAVFNRVKQEVAKLDEAYQVQLEEQVEQIKEGIVEKVDGYLDYVVEQWMEQNEIALERGMKSEILEGFVGGLKGLFEEHYIEIPEEKFDVLGSLEDRVTDLHTKLDEQVETNIGLKAKLAQYQIGSVVSSLSEGLVETDKEKFQALVEELEFDSVESFEKKAQTIRENYFTNKATTTVVESVITDTPVILSESKHVAPQMKGYLSILDNLK